MLKFALGPTGGLTYHLIALQSQKRWASFKSEVRSFLLERWNPTEPDLILIGPSAGWTLPLDWLSQFKNVVVVEPDPLARVILKRRCVQSSQLSFDKRFDRLPWLVSTQDRSEPLRALLDAHPRAAVLFSNVLGQMPLLLPTDFSEAQHQECRDAFLMALKNRNWASYHDVISGDVSGELKNQLQLSSKANGNNEFKNVADLAHRFFTQATEVVDHETMWLSQDVEVQYHVWPLTKKRIHVIGFMAPNSP